MRIILEDDTTLAPATNRLYDVRRLGAGAFSAIILDATTSSTGPILTIQGEDPAGGFTTIAAIAPSELLGPRDHWCSGPLDYANLRTINSGTVPVRVLLKLYDEPMPLYRGAYCALLDSRTVAAGATVPLPPINLGRFPRYLVVTQGDRAYNVLLTLGDPGFAVWNRGAIINVPGSTGGFGGFASGIPSATSAHPQISLSIQNLDGTNPLAIRTNVTVLGEA